MQFQSPRVSRPSTPTLRCRDGPGLISIPKGLTTLDTKRLDYCLPGIYFNPQGSHDPRRTYDGFKSELIDFNPQGSHDPRHMVVLPRHRQAQISIPKGLTTLDKYKPRRGCTGQISIPKGLTTLDCNCG